MLTRWGGRAVLLLLAVVAGLILLARFLPDTAPEGDFALIDIQARNTVRGWQGVGAYSRTGGFHPGPLYFQALAPLHVLADSRHAASVVTVLALNVLCLWGIFRVLRRAATDAALAYGVAVLLGVYLWRMNGLLTSVWNPHVALLPFLLMCLAAAAVISQRVEYLPVVVLAGSFAAQAHLSFLVPAAVVGVLVVAALLVSKTIRTRAFGRPGRRMLIASAAIAAIVWAIPLADELRAGGHHNLTRLYEFATERPPYDPRQASRAFEYLFVSPFTPGLVLWDMQLPAGPSAVRSLFTVQLALLALAAFWFHRRGRRYELAAAGVGFAIGLAGLVAVRRLPEAVHSYTVLWVTVAGVLTWALVLGAVLSAVPAARRYPVVHRGVTAIAALAVIGLLSAQLIAQVRTDRARTPRIVELANVAAARTRGLSGARPHVRIVPSDLGPSAGVVLALDRMGLEPSVNQQWVSIFGSRFAESGARGATFEVSNWDRHFEDLNYRSNYVRLAAAGNLALYEVTPPLEIHDQPMPFDEVERSIGVSRGPGSNDGRWMFVGPAEFITIRAAAGKAAALELVAERDTNWQIRCVRGPDAVERIGRVPLVATGASGAVFLRELAACPLVRISPADGMGPVWLQTVRLFSAR